MHGKNELRPRESHPEGKLQVQDIWYTIQGEGPFYGRPAIFIRLTGCNLACTFCDTKWDDTGDKYTAPIAVTNQVRSLSLEHNCNLVVLTGGEPCRQDLDPIIYRLVSGFKMEVQIETAGTFWQECLSLTGVTIVCSPKTKHVHPKIKEHCRHWKYVIQAGRTNIYDGLPAGCTQTVTVDMIKKFVAPDLHEAVENEIRERSPEQGPGLYAMVAGGQRFGNPWRPPEHPDNTIWLSPCNEGDPELNRRNMVLVGQLCMKFGYRAQVQLHNLLELP